MFPRFIHVVTCISNSYCFISSSIDPIVFMHLPLGRLWYRFQFWAPENNSLMCGHVKDFVWTCFLTGRPRVDVAGSSGKYD